MKVFSKRKKIGFALDTNIGIQKSFDLGADFVLTLNNGTIVDEYCINCLPCLMSEPNAAIVGPTIMYFPNLKSYSRQIVTIVN